MKFNPTYLEILVFLIVCLFIFIWTKHGRKLRRRSQDYFRRRRGPRNLKPESPTDCPLGKRHICTRPQRPNPELVPWSKRKSRHGRLQTLAARSYACLNLT